MYESVHKVLDDYSATLKGVEAKMDFEIFRKRLILSIGNSAKVRNALIASNNILENLSGNCVNNSIELQIKENEKALTAPQGTATWLPTRPLRTKCGGGLEADRRSRIG